MAQQILACIYGQEGNDWNNPNGMYRGFPTAGVEFIPLTGVIMSGVNINSKIKVLVSNSPYLTAPEFYTDRTVASLVTASNV